jgi:alpha-D-ribose 1-methylphosphonate 5-triphosphate diphosphatase
MKIRLIHARLVLDHEVSEDCSLLVEDDRITAIDPLPGNADREIDLRGAWLVPGLIDVHCDAIEKEIEPRPNVHFPLPYAIANADKRNAAAGITTVYHALSFAHGELGVRNVDMAATIAREIQACRGHALVDHRVHGRYEVTDESGFPVLMKLLGDRALDLISFMDHTPGQGQFKDLAAYRAFQISNYRKSAEEADQLVQAKIAGREAARIRVDALAERARQSGVRMASHDDDSPAKIAAMAQLGVSVSEFPVNLETAQAARAAGMETVFGSPNVMRGASQSGSMKAIEAIRHGVADCLCSDYAPAAMLTAAFMLPRMADIDLACAIRLVAGNPAKGLGLDDRGRIAPGLRADLVAVREVAGLPQVTHTFSAGRLAYHAGF